MQARELKQNCTFRPKTNGKRPNNIQGKGGQVFESLHELARTKQEIEYENRFYLNVQRLMKGINVNHSKGAEKCQKLYEDGKDLRVRQEAKRREAERSEADMLSF